MERTVHSALETYLQDRDLRSIVERQFITIGEAMTNLRRKFPGVADKLEQQGPLIAFRNFIVHRYWAIDDEQVWSVVLTKVGPLQLAVRQMMDDPFQPMSKLFETLHWMDAFWALRKVDVRVGDGSHHP